MTMGRPCLHYVSNAYAKSSVIRVYPDVRQRKSLQVLDRTHAIASQPHGHSPAATATPCFPVLPIADRPYDRARYVAYRALLAGVAATPVPHSRPTMEC